MLQQRAICARALAAAALVALPEDEAGESPHQCVQMPMVPLELQDAPPSHARMQKPAGGRGSAGGTVVGRGRPEVMQS